MQKAIDKRDNLQVTDDVIWNSDLVETLELQNFNSTNRWSRWHPQPTGRNRAAHTPARTIRIATTTSG